MARIDTSVHRLWFTADQVTRERVGVQVTGLAVFRVVAPEVAYRMLDLRDPKRSPFDLDLDVPQAVLSFGGTGLLRKDPDFIPAFVVNHILGGGSFSSRLYNEVREKRGLAYGVYSYLAPMEYSGLFQGGTQTRADGAKEALDVIEAEIRRMGSDGPSQEELDKAKSYLKGSQMLALDTSSKLAQAMLERAVIELGLGESFRRGQEGNLRAALSFRCLANELEILLGIAMAKAHVIFLAVAPDTQVEVRAERIDDGGADAVQAARHLVGILVELTAGMQLGHDDLGCRHAFLGVDIHRDAATVVAHGDGLIGMDDDLDTVAMTRQGLVDRVVDDLENHMVQARAVIGITDIHARALPHCIKAL